jgi:hypothetical protein
MTDPMDNIDANMKAYEKLREAAKKSEGVILTAGEVQRIQNHIKWLCEDRESLLSFASAFDDD